MKGIYNETGRHGNYDQAVPVWKGAVAVACGDLLYRDASGYDQPLANYTWDTNRLASQTADGGRQDGMILASGEFCFPCAALGADSEAGVLVTAAKQSGNALESQKVAITTTLGEAIGVLTEKAVTGQTYLIFKIVPVISVERGVQAIQ
jgi:hypothetical protein